MKYIYKLLKQRIAEISNLKEVLWFNGQYNQTGEQTLYVDRAAYIEFMPVAWQTRGQLMQEAVLEFDVHLVTETLGDNDERILDADVAHLDLLQEIFLKLQGWQAQLSDLPEFAGMTNSPKIINSIVRTGTTPDHTLSNLLISVQRFQCTVFDINAVPVYTPVTVALNLIVEKE